MSALDGRYSLESTSVQRSFRILEILWFGMKDGCSIPAIFDYFEALSLMPLAPHLGYGSFLLHSLYFYGLF